MLRHLMTRRGFIARTAAMFAGVTGFLNSKFQSQGIAQERPEKSRVVTMYHPGASAAGSGLDNADLDEKVVRQMVNSGILKFTGEKDLKQAWTQIIPDPTKKVAIKINCQIQGVYTKAKVVQPLVDGLISRGVPADNIIIYDMTNNAFELGGFKPNLGEGVKVGRVADFGGYSRFLYNRLANLLTGGYEHSAWNMAAQVSQESKRGSFRFLANLLLPNQPPSWNCEYLINVPVLKALDGYSGVTLSMKNHYGSFANPSEHHDDIMDHIPLINSRPEIHKKTRLIVLDAIFGEYKWKNSRDQRYVERVNKILISNDSVSIDTIGWKMIEEMRKAHGVGPVTPQPIFIAKAANMGLGNNAMEQIEHLEFNL